MPSSELEHRKLLEQIEKIETENQKRIEQAEKIETENQKRIEQAEKIETENQKRIEQIKKIETETREIRKRLEQSEKERNELRKQFDEEKNELRKQLDEFREQVQRERNDSRKFYEQTQREQQESTQSLCLSGFLKYYAENFPLPTFEAWPSQRWRTTSQNGKLRPVIISRWEDFSHDLREHLQLVTEDRACLRARDLFKIYLPAPDARLAKNEEAASQYTHYSILKPLQEILNSFAGREVIGIKVPDGLQWSYQIGHAKPLAEGLEVTYQGTSEPEKRSIQDRCWVREDRTQTLPLFCVLEHKMPQIFTPAIEALSLDQPIDISKLLTDPDARVEEGEAGRVRADLYFAEVVTKIHLALLDNGLLYGIVCDGRSALFLKLDRERQGSILAEKFVPQGNDQSKLLEMLLRMLMVAIDTPQVPKKFLNESRSQLPIWERNTDEILARLPSSHKGSPESEVEGDEDEDLGDFCSLLLSGEPSEFFEKPPRLIHKRVRDLQQENKSRWRKRESHREKKRRRRKRRKRPPRQGSPLRQNTAVGQ